MRVRRWWRSSASPSSGPSSGVSTTAAKKLVGHALELRHRLPRLWAQVHAGRVPAWRARAVAEATIHSTPALTVEAAGFVDAQVAAVAGRVGAAQLDRLVAETIKRYDLASTIRPRIRRTATSTSTRATPRSTTTTCTTPAPSAWRPSSTSPTPSTSTAPSPTAPPPEGPRLRRAAGRPTCRCPRRPGAHPDRARPRRGGSRSPSTCLPHAKSCSTPTSTRPSTGSARVFGPTGRMEEGQRLVLLDQVKDWCGDSRTKVTVKPVIDLNADLSTPAYEVPDRIREQVILRDRTCVFPWCTRPARGCDIDHVVPYDHHAEAEGRPQPGPTRSENLAALCRFHHRLKTHTAWRYRDDRPGVLRVDLTARPPLPTRPPRHHRDRPGRATRPARHPTTHGDDDPAPHPATHPVAGPQARRAYRLPGDDAPSDRIGASP